VPVVELSWMLSSWMLSSWRVVLFSCLLLIQVRAMHSIFRVQPYSHMNFLWSSHLYNTLFIYMWNSIEYTSEIIDSSSLHRAFAIYIWSWTASMDGIHDQMYVFERDIIIVRSAPLVYYRLMWNGYRTSKAVVLHEFVYSDDYSISWKPISLFYDPWEHSKTYIWSWTASCTRGMSKFTLYSAGSLYDRNIRRQQYRRTLILSNMSLSDMSVLFNRWYASSTLETTLPQV
jgi:hypothetical protein